MAKTLIASVLMSVGLFGCSHFGLGLPCTVGPIMLDKGASTRLTRSEKEQIVTLNETGESLCAWRAGA